MNNKFDPNDVGKAGQLFGFTHPEDEADLIILPIPCEVTASFGSGTSHGPTTILNASSQLDFGLVEIYEPWLFKVCMRESDANWLQSFKKLREDAVDHIKNLEAGGTGIPRKVEAINSRLENDFSEIATAFESILLQDKIGAVVGGDHSSAFPLIMALSSKHEIGILQIDAHMDLRKSYQGFTHSHASIMYNAFHLAGVNSITQVGIRDFSPIEAEFAQEHAHSVHIFYDDHLKTSMFSGKLWSEWVEEIVATLPEHVYISFDIDGLDPGLCPGTGTPVPGGLSFEQADYLIKVVVRSGKKIVGFDLCEVGSGTWDGNVGARVLYRLCAYLGISQGFIKTDFL